MPRPRRSSRPSRRRPTAARSRASGRCSRDCRSETVTRVNVTPPSVERRAIDRARQRCLARVVAGDDDERAVRLHDGLRADEDRGRADGRRPRDAAVVARLADGAVLLVVGVLGVAAAAERARAPLSQASQSLSRSRAARRRRRAATSAARPSSGRRRRASRSARSSACRRATCCAPRRTRRSDRTQRSPGRPA